MKKLIIILTIVTTGMLNAQQIGTYSQYMDNVFMLNPGAAGAYGIKVINLTSRQQAVGIDGAPSTSSVSYQGRILKKGWGLKSIFGKSAYSGKTKGNVGIGFSIFNDRFGLKRQNGAQFSYAYHMFLNETQISLGLSAQVYQMRLDVDKAIVNSTNDPMMYSEGMRSIIVPDFTTGVFVTHRSFYGGLSASSLAESWMKIGNDDYKDYHLKRHYYALAGYTFALNKIFIEPSLLYKTTGRLGNQLDVSTRINFYHAFWVGASLRTNGDIVTLAGVRFGDIYAGYAFDYATRSFKLNSYGTHELSISYKIGSTERRYRWMERY